MGLLEGDEISSDAILSVGISLEEFNASRTLTGLPLMFLPKYLDLWRICFFS
jgi:hypothetical protein